MKTEQDVRDQRSEVREYAGQSVDSREAQDNMISMLQHIRDNAEQTGKLQAIIGADFYITHNASYFEVWIKGVKKVAMNNLDEIIAMFDANRFMSGHVTE